MIPNFHEDTTGQPVDEELLGRLPPEPFILYVGAFRRIKGIDDLFDAYRRLDKPPPLVLGVPAVCLLIWLSLAKPF